MILKHLRAKSYFWPPPLPGAMLKQHREGGFHSQAASRESTDKPLHALHVGSNTTTTPGAEDVNPQPDWQKSQKVVQTASPILRFLRFSKRKRLFLRIHLYLKNKVRQPKGENPTRKPFTIYSTYSFSDCQKSHTARDGDTSSTTHEVVLQNTDCDGAPKPHRKFTADTRDREPRDFTQWEIPGQAPGFFNTEDLRHVLAKLRLHTGKWFKPTIF